MAEIIAETERLILRTEAPGDIDIWAEHMNTPAVMEFLGGPRTREKIEESFAKMAALRAQFGYGFALMQHKLTGELIGNCGIGPIDNPLAPQEMQGFFHIGWSLRESYWRQGYAYEAASAHLEIAFNRFEAPIVYALTSESNQASWGLMEKLGMQRRADLDFADPDYPPRDNPTMIYAIEKN